MSKKGEVAIDDVVTATTTPSDHANETKPVKVVRPTALRLTPCCSSLLPAPDLQRARPTTVSALFFFFMFVLHCNFFSTIDCRGWKYWRREIDDNESARSGRRYTTYT